MASDDECPDRSAISDELDVPDSPPDPVETSKVLPDEQLVYPDFEFPDGKINDDGSFSLKRSLNREEMIEWLKELAGGLASHDVGIKTAKERAIFGVGAQGVSVSFEPNDAHRGTLEVTLRIPAKIMTMSTDPEVAVAGARGGRGFIPRAMLTDDRELYRCYSWIDDPMDPASSKTDSHPQ